MKRQFSKHDRLSGTFGKLSFSPNAPPVVLWNWRSESLHSYLKSLWTFWETFSLKNMNICSIFALLRTILTFSVYRYFFWTSNLYNNICKISETYLSKNKPLEYCSWVTFKLPYNASVLLIDSDLLYICGIRWPPKTHVFRWPGASLCIQITSYMIWRPTGIQKTNFDQ